MTLTVTNAHTQYQRNVGHLDSLWDVCIEHCYYQSKHVQHTIHVTFVLFCQCNWHDDQDKKIINNKRIAQNSCFIFHVAIKLNFINIILSHESNGTSFGRNKIEFCASKGWVTKVLYRYRKAYQRKWSIPQVI